MSDKTAKHPEGAMLQHPDGSVYSYLQSSQRIESGSYVDLNINRRITKFQGGPRFPKGILMENVEKDEWTFVMVQEPRPKREKEIERVQAPADMRSE